MYIPTDYFGTSNSNINFRRASATYHIANSDPLPFPNTLVSAILPSPIDVKVIPPIASTVFDSPTLYRDPRATPRGLSVLIAMMFRFRRQSSHRS